MVGLVHASLLGQNKLRACSRLHPCLCMRVSVLFGCVLLFGCVSVLVSVVHPGVGVGVGWGLGLGLDSPPVQVASRQLAIPINSHTGIANFHCHKGYNTFMQVCDI